MKINQAGAHLDHMLKQSRVHHFNLSAMADSKANMLLTTASVLITLSAPRLIEPHFRIPAGILILFCLITVILATYAVMPKYTNSALKDMKPDIHNPKFNLLFFGDFIRLSYQEYADAMEELLNDHSLTYEAQVKELYNLGQFLGVKKYKYLRLAYLSFIIGFLSSGLSLIVMLLIK